MAEECQHLEDRYQNQPFFLVFYAKKLSDISDIINIVEYIQN